MLQVTMDNWFPSEPGEGLKGVFVLFFLLVAFVLLQFVWSRRSRFRKLKTDAEDVEVGADSRLEVVVESFEKTKDSVVVERGRPARAASPDVANLRSQAQSPKTANDSQDIASFKSQGSSPSGAQDAPSSKPAAGTAQVQSKPSMSEGDFSMSEIAKHIHKASPWIVVKKQVYDCTAYLKKHPGGETMIMSYAGQDCSNDFESIHSPDAWKVLEGFRIGSVGASASKPAPGKPGKTIQAEVKPKPCERKVLAAEVVSKPIQAEVKLRPCETKVLAAEVVSKPIQAEVKPKPCETEVLAAEVVSEADNSEREISMSEVKKHIGRQSAWIVVKGHVYDCTPYLTKHPGGESIILAYTGQDASSDFKDVHSQEAWDLLDGFRIGRLAGSRSTASSVKRSVPGASDVFLKRGQTLKMPLTKKDRVSHDSVILRFGLPTPLTQLGLPTGMHILFRADVNGEAVARQYTPISDNSTLGCVDFLVKIYSKGTHPSFPDGGKMSQHLDSLEIGDEIECKGPFGDITYKKAGVLGYMDEDRSCSRISFIAGGTGITPCYQIISAILRNAKDTTSVRLIYANQSPHDILLRQALERMAADNPERFRIWFTVDKVSDQIDWDYGIGFVDAAMISDHLFPAAEKTTTLMCGPPSMVQACLSNLEMLGHDEENIFSF